MRPAEKGFALLCCSLGDPDRPVLTTAQLRTLGQRVQQSDFAGQDRELTASDLQKLGYNAAMAQRIVALLEQEELLAEYLRLARRAGCELLSRVSGEYPDIVVRKLGLDSPGCLWLKGDAALLKTPCVALVGSREIAAENAEFARQVGMQAALQGYTLVSGNARGADRIAQNACLEHGGRVICIVADELDNKIPRKDVLYISEDGFSEPFSAQRAISRNRVIHILGRRTFVAQSDLHIGGTWDGSAKNLRHGWSDVYCFRDGSAAAAELEQMGAELIGAEALVDIGALERTAVSFLDS